MRFQDESNNHWETDTLIGEMVRLARARKKKQVLLPTLTSGFGAEVLRLTERDVEFLENCGIKVE